jgi:hypothetical protein
MVLTAARHTRVIAPPRPLAQEATVSTGLVDVIARVNADPSFRQAWQADPWLALACYDLANGVSSAGFSRGGR